MIPRTILSKVKEHITTNKILIVQGPRKVGKTALIKAALPEGASVMHLDASDKKTKAVFENPTKESIQEIVQGYSFIVIKDAQYLVHLQQFIEEILFGDYPVNLLLTCSFAPVIDDVLKEALESHGLIMTLYPCMFQEIANSSGIVEFDKTIQQRLVYGNYPQAIEEPQSAEAFLLELINDVIFTHLNPSERINKSDKLIKMLQILAFDMGEPISYNDIGFRSGLDNETVERYIHLLQRAFILIRIPSFYNGHKYELKKTHTVYFTDNGIRNAIIRNFNDPELRNDMDVLWKNWLIAERMKWNAVNENYCQYYFWRTHTRQTMDFIEVRDNKVTAYKSIWDKRKKPKFPASFKTAYPDASTHALNRSTYWGFLSKK